MFKDVQTLNVNLNEINCLAVTQPPKRIIAGGKRLVFYDYDEPTDHHLADEQACLCVLYNPVFYTFITAHPKCVKIWDASNGTLQNVYRDISTKDITCICLDERKRKLFVGDQRGRIYCINVKNGVEMKRFKKPKEENVDKEKEDISCLHYWGKEKNSVIAVGWDKLIRLFDDSDTEREGEQRYTIPRHTDAINYVDFRIT